LQAYQNTRLSRYDAVSRLRLGYEAVGILWSCGQRRGDNLCRAGKATAGVVKKNFRNVVIALSVDERYSSNSEAPQFDEVV